MDDVHSKQVRGFFFLNTTTNQPLNPPSQSLRFAKWKREAEYWFEKDSVMFEGLFNSVRERLVCLNLSSSHQTVLMGPQSKGIDCPSLAGSLIKDADKYGLSPLENSWLAATL